MSSTSHLNSALLLLDRVEAMASGYLDGLHYRRALALLALGDKNAARTAALAELAHNLYHVQAQNMVYSLSPREVVSMDVLRRYGFI